MSRHAFARPRGWSWRSFTCDVCEGKGWELENGIGVPCRFCLGMVKMSLSEIAERLPTVTRATLARVARSFRRPTSTSKSSGASKLSTEQLLKVLEELTKAVQPKRKRGKPKCS